MPSPWLIGAGLSAASQFVPRRKFTTLTKRTKRTSTRIPKAVRATYMRAKMNKNPALAANAKAYRTAVKYQYGNKKQTSLDMGLTRQYSYKRTKLYGKSLQPRLLIPYTVDRLQGIKKEQPDQDPNATLNFFPGYAVLQKGDPALTDYVTPIAIFDLTKFSNIATATPCARILKFSNGAEPQFDDLTSQNSSGADVAPQYIAEYQSYGVTSNPTIAKVQAAWYDIRMKLYGARKQAVTYDVMLVRFKRPEIIPDNVGAIPISDPMRVKARLFYQELTRQYTVNSIFKPTATWKNHVQILKSKRIKLPPSDADDLDRNPESVDFKWFIKDMKIRNYVETINAHTSDTSINSPTFITNAQSIVRNDPYPTSRLYLIVAATDMTTANAINDDMDDSPSFDYSIRRKLFLYGPSV